MTVRVDVRAGRYDPSTSISHYTKYGSIVYTIHPVSLLTLRYSNLDSVEFKDKEDTVLAEDKRK